MAKISGKISGVGSVTGAISAGGNVEPYRGEYSFEPDRTVQTVPINGKMATKDITFGKIPDEYIDTTDADATADDIVGGKTAYVKGEKLTGTGAYIDAFIDGSFSGELTTNVTVFRQYILSTTGVTKITAPNLETAYGYAVNQCTRLTEVTAPKLRSLYYAVFGGCPLLEKVDMMGGDPIGANTFYSNAKMDKLILRSTVLVPLNNSNAFTNTPFWNNNVDAYLYVPQALIEEYRAATNWSFILATEKTYILPIEGSIYDTD